MGSDSSILNVARRTTVTFPLERVSLINSNILRVLSHCDEQLPLALY